MAQPCQDVGFSLQVKYRSSKSRKQEGSPDLPNLLQLEHALNASKLQSSVGPRTPPGGSSTWQRLTDACVCVCVRVCVRACPAPGPL